jgi:TatD DNase family protein
MQEPHGTDTPPVDGTMLVDSHCHLDARQFARESTATLLRRAAEAGVHRCVTIGTDLPSSRRAAALAEAHDEVFAAVGIDPNDLDGFGDASLAALADLAASPKVVAVGEIGLDYHWQRSSRDVQLGAFRAQLDLARDLGLPVVIHDRDAHDDTVEVLLAWAARDGMARRPLGVLHCFSGDLAMAQRLVTAGFLVSFAGNVTYPTAAGLRAVARGLGEDDLLLETDSPYLAPVPRRGERNEPAYVRLTADRVAAVRETSVGRLASVTSANAGRLFRWDDRAA